MLGGRIYAEKKFLKPFFSQARTMNNPAVGRRFLSLLKERRREPLVGVAVGALGSLLLCLGRPLARSTSDSIIAKASKGVFHAASWGPREDAAAITALAALSILLLRPAWCLGHRVRQSWAAGLLSGIGPVWAVAAFLILLDPPGPKLWSHICYWGGTALAYSFVALLFWARRPTDIDRTSVIRQLDLPRSQVKEMRCTVLPDDIFASVLDNPNPITTWKNDWVGRAAFVESVLQRVIINEDPIVAVVGGFGEGKTSILNLIKEALGPCREILGVPFTSFLPGDEKTLVASLLGSVTAAIRRRFIVPGLRKDFARYGRTLAGVIPKMGESLRGFFERPSQAEEVADLRDLLNRLPVRVVVLLDEIDRLQRDELLALLKVLRGVADLPRLRFVCAFNKEALLRVVSGGNPGEGCNYLEKFFPVELAIPKIDEEGLKALFWIRLSSLREKYSRNAPDDAKEVAEQWDQLWFSAGKRYFVTLRRLSTYFKNLEAASRAIGNEVNFFDLSVLEAVRQVSPSTFEFIYNHGNLFYFPSWRLSLWPERVGVGVDDKEEQKQITSRLDAFFSSLDDATRQIVAPMLGRIFPSVAACLGRQRVTIGAPSADATEADRLKRIYHPDYFHRYFTSQVPASLYGEQELTEFINRLNDADGEESATNIVREELAILSRVPVRRSDFFDRLPEASQRLKPEKAEMLAHRVADVSSQLAADILGGEQGRARALIFVVANRFTDTTKAHAILERAIRGAASDGFAADLLQYCIDQGRNKIIRDWENIDPGKLELAFSERMKARYSPLTDVAMPRDPHTLRAFFRWSRTSKNAQADVIAYVRSRLDKSGSEVANFISWLFPGDVVYGSNPAEVVELLFPVEELRRRTLHLERAVELTEVQREALDRFRKLCPPNGAPAAGSETGASAGPLD
jgi:predicted KAP-like P-loop ATPase